MKSVREKIRGDIEKESYDITRKSRDYFYSDRHFFTSQCMVLFRTCDIIKGIIHANSAKINGWKVWKKQLKSKNN